MEFKSVSILMAAINEIYSFRQTFDIIAKTCNPADIEEIIIILCERTTKECRETANEIMAIDIGVPIKILYQAQDMPFAGGAFREGFKAAIGSHVIVMGTDLETDPYLVHTFIERAKLNPDAIITASRWINGGGFKGYNKVKLVCNYVFQKILSLIFLTKLTDITFGFQLSPTKLVRSIKWDEFRHPFFLETTLKPLRLGTKFIEVPMKWVARNEGKSQNSFILCFTYLRTVFHVRFMKKSDILEHHD